MIAEEVEPPHKEETEPQPLSFSSLPEEIIENILARISKWNYPNLSLVSKRFLSLLSSPQLYTTRSHIGTTEPCLYFCLKRSEHKPPNWFTLWMKPADETLIENDDIPDDYSLVPVPSYSHPHCVPYHSTVAAGSEIYLIGAPFESPPFSAVRILDCLSNTRRDGPNMNVARECADAVFVDGNIYVMGGCGEDESMAWMEVLNINTQTWSSLPSHGAHELRSDPGFTINVLEVKTYAIAEKDYAYDPKKVHGKCRNALEHHI